jgi:GntR family transcriptional regulator/MocR family aminotransferase
MLTYDLDKRESLTIYEYLYKCIKNDILSGVLGAGAKLPSKRGLAKHHQISLKTVENAYEQLAVEGYIYSEEKRGYFVAEVDASANHGKCQPHTAIKILQDEENDGEFFIDFTSNQAAIEKFPYNTWVKIMRGILSRYDTDMLKTVSFQGLYELREAIAGYLYGFRGMAVSPDQIIVGAGTEYIYARLIQLLGKNHVYALENPGYRKISKIYKVHGVEWKYIDIDENGIIVDKLYESGASVVHVSPAHHFPTGCIMPISRRQQLLEWALEDADRYIIEDDYDSEFRFSHRPIPAIQSLNHNHRVIYMNTFSKTLAPSIRVSYMVLPLKLMERYVDTMNFYSCTVSSFEQYALAEFMNKGYFERHIQRMKKYYKTKRDAMLKVFEKSKLSGFAVIDEKDAGNHFLMRIINTTLSDTELKWLARQNGIKLDCLSEYCESEKKDVHSHTVIVNYSDIDEDGFGRALEVLYASLSS